MSSALMSLDRGLAGEEESLIDTSGHRLTLMSLTRQRS
jgi:hypothetical protein